MLVLHASLVDDRVLLWGEAAEAQLDGPSPLGGEVHPTATSHDGLVDVVGRLLGGNDLLPAPTRAWARAWLPTRDSMPVASSGLLRGEAGSDDASVGSDVAVASALPATLQPLDLPVLELPAATAAAVLAACGPGEHPPLPGVLPSRAVRVLSRIVRHAAAIVVRQEFLPELRATGANGYVARWTAAARADARDALHRLAGDLPAATFALTCAADAPLVARSTAPVPPPTQVVDRLVDRLVDAIARDGIARVRPQLSARTATTPHDRWLLALGAGDERLGAAADQVDADPDQLERLAADVREWQARLRSAAESPFRLCVRLEEPVDTAPAADDEDDDAAGDAAALPLDTWHLRYLLQSRAEPSVLIDLATAWSPMGADATTLRRLGFDAGLHLLAPLGEAARLSEPIEHSLRDRHPAGCELDTAQAHEFLTESVPLLEQAGIGVFVPAWWHGGRGSRAATLNVRAQVATPFAGGRRSLSSLNLETLVGYDWRLAIGDAVLSQAELDTLARQKASLVRVRGTWVELGEAELRAAIRHVERFAAAAREPGRAQAAGDEGEGSLSATIGELVGMSVGAGIGPGGIPVGGLDDGGRGDVADLLRAIGDHEPPYDPEPPAGLTATLRPYQLRGFAWLDYMAQLGLGACLADDMGLGKSVQALAVIQRAWERPAGEGDDDVPRGPSLLACPTSVLTNWQREAARFTPELPVHVHHGAGRLRGDELLKHVAGQAIVVTSYALLARDIDTLAQVHWRHAILDEAQAIKNPGTRHAVAARTLLARARFALTGTPIENGVGDLWSIMEFLNPGLLGGQAQFRQRYMLPIQTGAATDAGERLRQLTSPFLLRRLKTDRSVIADLPDKFERTAYAMLTTEQVTLYEAIVRDAETIIRGRAAAGVERRGVILATLSKLKQACNHPGQLLGDNSAPHGRSGKLALLEELLEQVLDRGERALVFTQFVGMGTILQRALQESFGREVLFLHGGTTRKRRDEIVARFQAAGDDAPPVLVLSLKAGGSGLNLTAATHVVHYDRWWNPATEQQATDRAFRIGQTRDVQVHTLVCAGTVEEQVDLMLRQKRGIAERVIGTGETWITELPDDELIDLLRLRQDTLVTESRLDDTGMEWHRGAFR